MQLEDLIRCSPHDGLMAIDMDFTVVVYNPAAARLLGVPAEQVIGRHIDTAAPGVAEESRYLAHVLERGETVSMKPVELRNGLGFVPLVLSTFPVRAENGELLGAGAVFHDVSLLGVMHDRLAESERLASLGQLAASIAHEVRNPLTAVRGFLDLARRRQDLSKLDLALPAMDHALSILNSLMDVARPSDPEEDPVDVPVDNLVDEVLALFGDDLMAHRIDLVRHRSGVRALVQAKKIRQVFFNLIQNAIQAMPQGGLLEVSSSCHQQVLTVSVRDTGPGIPPEQLAVLGTPFFTTRPDGAGLGLSIVKRVLGSHGGHLKVESRVGYGSTFSVELPLPAPCHT